MKPSVLIVDDENVICEGIARLLAEKYTTYLAQNGKEAIDILKANKDIAVVLCDIIMPEMDGNALIKEIRSENKDIIMIVMTAFADPNKVCEAMKQGANNFMLKPFNIPLLEMTINSAVRKKGHPLNN
ncbi:MAG: response regulator [Nitrospirae bacterium]|nr:response regulator [Nitrospirota bacterium]